VGSEIVPYEVIFFTLSLSPSFHNPFATKSYLIYSRKDASQLWRRRIATVKRSAGNYTYGGYDPTSMIGMKTIIPGNYAPLHIHEVFLWLSSWYIFNSLR
jgi:hypothetical protein